MRPFEVVHAVGPDGRNPRLPQIGQGGELIGAGSLTGRLDLDGEDVRSAAFVLVDHGSAPAESD